NLTTSRNDVFPVDGVLQARSGADDALSSIAFAQFRYGGGAVPRTAGSEAFRNDTITLRNSRPTIADVTISNTGAIGSFSGNSPQAPLSRDLDSFPEDDVARGPLIRRVTLRNNSLNGIYIPAYGTNGVVEATNAMSYLDNPTSLGGAQNYTFFA